MKKKKEMMQMLIQNKNKPKKSRQTTFGIESSLAMANEVAQGEVEGEQKKAKTNVNRKDNDEEVKGGEEKHEICGNENIAKLLSVPRVAQQVFSMETF